MAINRGTFDKLSTLKSNFPVVEVGDYAEIIEDGIAYVYSQNGWNPGTPADYSNSFIELSDTPVSYHGQAGKVPAVNPAENGLIFVSGEGEGDMLVTVYDPDGISANIFDVDNHIDGSVNKVFTAVEKTKLSEISGSNTGDESQATIKTKLGSADTTNDGYITHDDWNIFNGKQDALGYTPENIANIRTAFQVTPDNTHYPSEKLVKDQLNLKVNVGDAIVAPGVSKFGSATDYSEFEADGTLHFAGESVVWDDIIITASNLRSGNTPPTFLAFMNGIYGFRFDAGVADELHGAFEIPHDYKQGSDLYLHCHWSPTTTNNGNVVFGSEYTRANIGDIFPPSTPVVGTPTPAGGVANKHYLFNIGILVGTNFKIGDIIAFRFYRQNGGTDTFTGNAFVHSIGIHYQIDTVGSRSITTK